MLRLTIGGQTQLLPDADTDDALRLYWEAKQRGDTTASVVRVEEEEPSPDPEPDPPAAPAMAQDKGPTLLDQPIGPVGGTRAGQISTLAKDRIEQQERWLTAAGFAVPAPIYAPGTRVVNVGDGNFRLEREEVESMARFDEAAEAIIARIKAEDRSDHEVSLRSLTLSPRGSLFVGNHEEYALEPGAFSQLAGLGGFGSGARYLRELCDPDIRSANVNWQLMNRPNRRITLRTRRDQAGRRQVFAVVTPSYTPVDTDVVLDTIRPALVDARTELVYDGSGVRGQALWMPDTVVDLAAGDVFKVGVRLHTNDVGKGRIGISAVVFRNLCLNLIIIGEAAQATVSQVHRGNTHRIIAGLEEGVEQARAKVADFIEAWGHARTITINVIETLEEWVADKRVEVKGERDKAQLVGAFVSAWAKEPGETLADAVNAITRAAHENQQWSLPVREALEVQAAQLVYAYAA